MRYTHVVILLRMQLFAFIPYLRAHRSPINDLEQESLQIAKPGAHLLAFSMMLHVRTLFCPGK